MLRRRLIIKISLMLLFTLNLSMSQLTQLQMDSGWVSVFNGQNLDGFYTVMGGTVGLNENNNFSVDTPGEIHVKGSGQKTGHIATDKKYSYYKYTVDMKFANAGNLNQNAGCLYHIREEAPKLGGTYPRSMEAQGQKRGMGEIWTISDVWITSTIESNSGKRKFMQGGIVVDHGDPNGRQMLGSHVPFNDGTWNTLELVVHGSDSVAHLVNGETVFRAWDLRIAADNAPNDKSDPLFEGNIGLQSEGAEISYRNIFIMELDPATLMPLNIRKGCTDSTMQNYDDRALVDDSSCVPVGVVTRDNINQYFSSTPNGFTVKNISSSLTVRVYNLVGHDINTEFDSGPKGDQYNISSEGIYFVYVTGVNIKKIFKINILP